MNGAKKATPKHLPIKEIYGQLKKGIVDSAAAGVLNGRVTEAENPSLKSALKMIAGIQKEREGQPELDMAEGIQLVLDKITGFTNKPSYEI